VAAPARHDPGMEGEVMSETKRNRGLTKIEVDFLKTIKAYFGAATRREVGPPSTREIDRARQYCRKQGLAYWDGYYWRITKEGCSALAKAQTQP